MSDPVRILVGDCLEAMRGMDAASVDAIVTDPPYGLSFMGKHWDHGVPGVEFWAEALRVAKPGTHMLAFGGTRTYHRLACAIEDAGWEVRDCIAWVYGSGFPKSLDVSKAIDKRGGYPHLAAQIGDALRSARKSRGLTIGECDRRFCGGTTNWSWFEGRPKGQRAPTPETFSAIAEEWTELSYLASVVAEAEREVVGRGVSGIGTAFGDGEWAKGGSQEFKITAPATDLARQWSGWGTALKPAFEPIIVARKPLIGTVAENVTTHGTGAINVDGCRVGTEGESFRAPQSDPSKRHGEVGTDLGISRSSVEAFQAAQRASIERTAALGRWPANLIHDGSDEVVALFPSDGEQSAARFFYAAKASRRDREEGCEANHHPTVKPTALMRYLCRLVTPPGGIVLDPFAGSGSTGKGAVLEGFNFIGIELDAEYAEIARARIGNATPADKGLFA